MTNTRGAMRWLAIAVAAFALAIVAVAFAPQSAQAGTIETVHLKGTVHQTEARSMLAMVNEFRTTPITDHSPDQPWYWADDDVNKVDRIGLKPLKWSYKLEKTAIKRAKELVIMYDHESPNGTDYFDGYTSIENIAAGQTNAKRAYIAWREDNEKSSGQGHRAGMLSNCASVGIACVEGESGVKFWAMELGSPSGDDPEIPAEEGNAEWDCDVDTSLVTSVKADSRADLKVGGSTAVPSEVTAWVKMDDGWERNRGAKLAVDASKGGWASSDPEVVSVSGGTMRALSVGSVTLRTTVLGHELSYPVTVTRRDANLSLPATKTVTMGFPCRLDVSKDGDGGLTYESGDPSVAEVSSDGVVTPVSPGKTTITVSSSRTDTYEAETASFVLTVRAESTPLTVDVPDTLYAPECGSFDFECPSTSYVEWTSSDESVLMMNASQWFSFKPGTVTVTASVPGNDCWPAASVSRRVKVVAKGAAEPVAPVPGGPTTPSAPKPSSPSVTPAKPTTKPSAPKVAPPKGTSLTKLSKAKRAFTAKWRKASGVKGYQVRWSTKSSMKGSKSTTVRSAKTTSKKVTKLKRKTRYYVQVRTYKVVKGKTYWSGWSKARSVKTK